MASQRLSFATDVRPLFRDVDVSHMKPFGYDLSDYDDVKEKADSIYGVLASGTMPPDKRWTEDMCATFKSWQDEGCPP
jgi:hypothetical protein